MYPYHNEIKKRIRNGELTGYEFVENYKKHRRVSFTPFQHISF